MYIYVYMWFKNDRKSKIMCKYIFNTVLMYISYWYYIIWYIIIYSENYVMSMCCTFYHLLDFVLDFGEFYQKYMYFVKNGSKSVLDFVLDFVLDYWCILFKIKIFIKFWHWILYWILDWIITGFGSRIKIIRF